MQYRRAMRVEHALGIAGGTRGVAQRRGRVLVELRPFVVVGLGRQQVFVAVQVGDRGAGHLLPTAQCDPALDTRTLRRQSLDQRGEIDVEEDVAVIGVVGDVGDLFREQARIDGVADGGHARYGVVDLEMAVGIPRQGADAVAGADAERQQHARQLPRAATGIGVGVAMGAADRQAGDDFSVAVILARMLQEAGNHQLPVHHQALHGPSFRNDFSTTTGGNLSIGIRGRQSTNNPQSGRRDDQAWSSRVASAQQLGVS